MLGLRRVTGLFVLASALASTPAIAQQQPANQNPKQVDEFVPLENLPPQEQMPAAPLVIGAYSFVWAALFVYLVSVARRLGTVQREVERLETDMKQGKRP